MDSLLSVEEFDRRVAALMARPLFSGRYLNLTFPPGWVGLIEHLVAELEALPGGNALRCSQLKVKMGRLRLYLYLDTGDMKDDLFHPADGLWVLPRPDGELEQRAEALILEAEEKAASQCILCGQPASLQQRGMSPLCDHHQATDLPGQMDVYKTFFPG